MDNKEKAKLAAKSQAAKNTGKTFEPVAEITSSMYQGVVRRKDLVKEYGEWGAQKFYAEIHDGITTHCCLFDSVHQNSFEQGDRIGFEAIAPTTNLQELEGNNSDKPNIYRIMKKHKICNITRNEGGTKSLVLRPKEEILYLREKCEKRFRQIVENKKKPNIDKEVLNLLIREQRDIAKLGGILKFAHTGEFPESPDADPRQAFKCQIVARYLGEEDLASILHRCQSRLVVIKDEALEHKEANEYTDLLKLEAALKWLLDITKDGHLGDHFGWSIFSKRVKDKAFFGEFVNDFLVKERREKDNEMLRDEAKTLIQKENQQEMHKELMSTFSTLAKFGPPPKDEPKKNIKSKKKKGG